MSDVQTQVARMFFSADGYLTGHEILSSKVDSSVGEAAVHLHVLAFEIFLKATYMLSWGKPARFGHRYRQGFRSLPSDVIDAVIEAGTHRYAGHVNLSAENCDVYLNSWQNVFERGRYSYEATQDETVNETGRRGKEWLERGAKPEEADFAYYPMELSALVFGLREWLAGKLNTKEP